MEEEIREIIARAKNRNRCKVACPFCEKTRHNPKEHSMSVDLVRGLYHCFHCGAKGRLKTLATDDARRYTPTVPAAGYVRPDSAALMPRLQVPGPAWMDYLTHARGIPAGILRRMNICECREWMPQTRQPESCIVFPYMEDGTLVNLKYRTLQKQFKLISGAELIPWNVDALRGKKRAFITEGEMDALTLLAAGYEEVVSVPNGAGGINLDWLDRFVDSHFADKDSVTLALDTDDRGRELCRELLRRLGDDLCRIVDWGGGCKDANEHLLKYGMDSLRQAVDGAREIPIDGVFSAADEYEDLMNIYRHGLPPGKTLGFSNMDVFFSLSTGRLLVITGIPGHGKSEFLDELVTRLLVRYGWRAAFFSPEKLPHAVHLSQIAERIIGKSFREGFATPVEVEQTLHFLGGNLFSILPEDDYTIDTVLRIAKSLIRRYGIRVLALDPLNCFDHRRPSDQSETQYLDRLLWAMSGFAKQNDILLILVAHPTKMHKLPGQKEAPAPDMYDVAGSAAFANKADYILSVFRSKTEGYTQVRVEKVRFGYEGSYGEAFFRFVMCNNRYTPCELKTQDNPRPPEPEWDHTNWMKQVEERTESQGELWEEV